MVFCSNGKEMKSKTHKDIKQAKKIYELANKQKKEMKMNIGDNASLAKDGIKR